MTSVEINGARIHYEEHGAGEPLVLLHGGLVSSASWEPALPHLTGELRVITPDTRGHGRSTNPSGELSYPRHADDVAALIAALELDRPIVGGYSDGGQIALELGVRHPEAARALIVAAAHPGANAPPIAEAAAALLGGDDPNAPDVEHVEAFLGDFAALIKSWHVGGEPQWRALVQLTGPMWLAYAGLTEDEVRRIEVPVLLFTGDRDEMVPLDMTLSLYRTLPNAELAVAPGADHAGPILPDRAEVLAVAIRDFARRHARPG
jgi:pimeloyl-ACP methyl ester carboxylesterase